MNTSIYFIGSGASRNLCIPTFSDFKNDAESMLKDITPKNNSEYLAQEALKDWNYRFNTRDLEEYYQILDLENLTSSPLDRLKLPFTVLRNPQTIIKNDKSYFAECLISHVFVNKELQAELNKPLTYHQKLIKKIKEDNSIIITTNWDCMLEYSAMKEVININYCTSKLTQYEKKATCLFSKDEENNNCLDLLKLHGSLNWAISQYCKSAHYFNNILCDYYYSLEPECLCPECINEHRILRTLIVPPTISKLSEKTDIHSSHIRPDEIIRPIWRKALDFLSTSDRLTFIGYSMPSSDILIRSLLIRSLENRKIDVTVVDKPIINENEKKYAVGLKNRYKMIFPYITDDDFKFIGFKKYVECF